MKINSRLYLTLSCMGVLVRAEWRPSNFIPSPEDKVANNVDSVKVVEDKIHEESVHGHESTKRYSEKPDFVNRVPSEFAQEISRLSIPDERLIPRTLSSDEAQSEEDESDASDDDEDKSEENRADDDERSKEEEDDSEENKTKEKEEEEEDEERGEYDDYDELPLYESKKEVKKPLPKRPGIVHYEVTEHITGDTKPQRPKGPVYPLPPPCPGAPPPTFPPPPPPTVKPPLPPPPPPPRPRPHKNFFPVADVPTVNHIPFFDSYFPTSYMSQSHSVPQEAVLSPTLLLKGPIPIPRKAKSLGRFPRRASPQRVIIRYHRPAYVVRKVQQVGPVADAVIVRHLPPPGRTKEVHIHHHHTPRQPAGPVIHVHKNDDDDALEEARFTAELAGQKLFSEAALEAATSGPFAEPSLDFSTRKRSASPKEEIHIHE